ncbi:MAG: hypothetical protein K1X94_34540 [Sandaracinaceae bacterium]|nr:hypothetical protein [Sandaracinaceae bacterium]
MSSLTDFLQHTHDVFRPIDTELVADVRARLAGLGLATEEPWLRALRDELPPSRELHREPNQGWVLLAHSEHGGLYRPPHDHGRSWVVYALAQGEMEISTYARVGSGLVKRDTTLLRPGDARVYLPGDIHDTRCLRGPSILFRFTERDLKVEDLVEHRLTRYVERDGVWTAGPA